MSNQNSSVATDSPIDEEFLKSHYEDFFEEEDYSFFIELFERFLSSAPGRLGEVKKAIQSADPKALRFHAHSLKNISMNVGGRLLSSLALKLENLSEQTPLDMAEISGLEPIISKEFSRLESAVQQKLQDLKNKNP